MKNMGVNTYTLSLKYKRKEKIGYKCILTMLHETCIGAKRYKISKSSNVVDVAMDVRNFCLPDQGLTIWLLPQIISWGIKNMPSP